MGRWAPCNGHLAADEMPSQPKDTHGIWGVKCKRNLEYQGFIHPDLTCLSSPRRQLTECGMPDERLRDLDDAISSCFSAGSAGCLLTSCGVSSAIFKNPEGGVVVFDSHAKDVTGRTFRGKVVSVDIHLPGWCGGLLQESAGRGDQILPYGVPGPAKLDKGSSWSELLQTLTDALSNRAPLPPAGQWNRWGYIITCCFTDTNRSIMSNAFEDRKMRSSECLNSVCSLTKAKGSSAPL